MTTPVEVFHPSVHLRDELNARGWSDEHFARLLGGDERVELLAFQLYESVGPTMPDMYLGHDCAERYGRVLGASGEMWLNLERAWREWYVEKMKEKA